VREDLESRRNGLDAEEMHRDASVQVGDEDSSKQRAEMKPETRAGEI